MIHFLLEPASKLPGKTFVCFQGKCDTLVLTAFSEFSKEEETLRTQFEVLVFRCGTFGTKTKTEKRKSNYVAILRNVVLKKKKSTKRK